ncbi:hypothetical protein [Paenibacillus sp. B01]|uniref:hypothetical protein n=1 Tax=Paenibacillus sp. B01 TaxID=2660554 RepID=UPI00129ADBB8|nr:hypothetical protein [Paenibacillus sp. B01]QGG54909.1 hypothetical protein GE073_04445 [Paenibacillus sp. B01]
MKYVKLHAYHVQKEKRDEYLDLQRQAAEVYGRHASFRTLFLNSMEDETRWIEITTYDSEESYAEAIRLIDEEPEIGDLFRRFKSLLVQENAEIVEEDFKLAKEIVVRTTE